MFYNEKLFSKYLELLKVEAAVPSFKLLKKVVKAHLIKVPFENISKMYFKQQGANYIPDLPEYLEGIEKFNFGGTCYANNYYLFLLLKHLGFNIKLCGADMRDPDVHVISMVNIEGHEYMIDVGYAAPFFEPLSRELREDYVVTLGNEKHILKPKNNDGTSRLEQHCDGELKHWYTAEPKPREIEDFRKVIEESYADDALFMNVIRITSFSETGSLEIRNLVLTEKTNSKFTKTQLSIVEIPDVIQNRFGIPGDIVEKAISRIDSLKNI